LVKTCPQEGTEQAQNFENYKLSFCSEQCWNDHVARTLYTNYKQLTLRFLKEDAYDPKLVAQTVQEIKLGKRLYSSPEEVAQLCKEMFNAGYRYRSN